VPRAPPTRTRSRLRRVLVVDEIPLLPRELGFPGASPRRASTRASRNAALQVVRARGPVGERPPPPSAIAARVWRGAGASNSPRSARAGGVEADERAAHRPPHHECGTSPRRSSVGREGEGEGGDVARPHPEPIQTSRACRSHADEQHVEEARSLHRRQTISHRARSQGAHSSRIRTSDSFGKASK
jgi:hypothetical protein